MQVKGLSPIDSDGKALQQQMTLRIINLVPLNLSPSSPSVFPSVVGVAVAKSSSKNMVLGNLHGRRSCHSYTYSPAGWLLPYRYMLDKEQNSSSPCDPNQGSTLKQLRGSHFPEFQFI